MRPYSSLIFDLDGTLIDSVVVVRAALNQLLNEYGRHSLSDCEVRMLVGEGVEPMINNAFAQTGNTLPPRQINPLAQRYLAYYLNTGPDRKIIYPGVIELLEVFANRDIKMGICTNKPKQSTHATLEALDLAHYFSAVICPEDTPYRKPDPRHVEHTLINMGGEKISSLFIGDSESDLTSAHSAQIPCVLVSYGYAKLPVLQLSADYVIDYFSDLLSIVFDQDPSLDKHLEL